MRFIVLALALSGCAGALSTTPTTLGPSTALVDFSAPGPIAHEAWVSARWEVSLSGLLDLEDPRAQGIEDISLPIVLPVHVLTHPEHGVFIIDTGVDADIASGGSGPARGLVARFLKGMVPEASLADILAAQSAPLAGVPITHAHLDHILGLGDVPDDVPIYVGPGEGVPAGLEDRLVQPTTLRAFGEHTVHSWTFDTDPLGIGLPAADVLGDGSLWVIHTPGHTPGSVSFLARTTEGPMLFTGDTAHTRWGWENNVPSGTFSADKDAHAASLSALQLLLERTPTLTVEVGHEAFGIDAVRDANPTLSE